MEMLNLLPPELLRIVISAVIVVAFVFLNCMVLGYAERKLAGFFQMRPGPM
jgi:NADH-quinone oxidoreductase subunit H